VLTDTAIRKAKGRERPYKLADGGGLYLLVNPTGKKYWRLKYRHWGKEKVLALGVYPEVTLAQARDGRDDAKRLLREKQDPVATRQRQRQAAESAAANTFEHIAREWVAQQRHSWTPDHADRVLKSLEKDVFPEIGTQPISEINAQELLVTLRKVEKRGATATAQRSLQRCSAIFRYCIASSRCTSNPAADLKGALKPHKTTSRAALSAAELPEFLNKLDIYDGRPETKIALRLLILTFVRPGELRAAQWSEFDLAKAEWRIPAERMKMRTEHVVPLSTQAVKALEELHPLTGYRRLLFPNQSNPQKCMSENTLLFAMYRMGYHSRATAHGFRATASTILNEQGYRPDVIERQLAHVERNKVRAAYNRASYLEERRKMMQAWADYLDGLATGANVVPLHGAAKC
jgi:integrase